MPTGVLLFFVVATQNPYEFEGTYPLPESPAPIYSLSGIRIGYPDRIAQVELLIQHRAGEPVDALGVRVGDRRSVRRFKSRFGQLKLRSRSRITCSILSKRRASTPTLLWASVCAALNLYSAAQSAAFLDAANMPSPTMSKEWPFRCWRMSDFQGWPQGLRDDLAMRPPGNPGSDYRARLKYPGLLARGNGSYTAMSTKPLLLTVRPELPEEVFELTEPVARHDVQRMKMSRESLFWLLATFLLFVTGLFKGINLLVLLAYLLAGIWLFNRLVLLGNLRRVQGGRLPPGVIFAGAPVNCAIELACSGNAPSAGLSS